MEATVLEALAGLARIRIESNIGNGGPPPLGVHLLMGSDAPQKLANVVDSLKRGLFARVEMICRRR